MRYERSLEDNIFALQAALLSGDFRHDAYIPFTIFDPKQRRIHKASVRDRMIHQAVVNVIEPLFEGRFIFDSYSCRVGKGTHAGVARLRSFLRRASRNNTKTVYVLQCDIRKFFDSVDHEILYALLARRIHDGQALQLLRVILESFSSVSGKGLPLGNITSQLFANIYLHELDWHIKHILRESYYLRYCDDFVVVSASREHLDSLIPQIADMLRSSLRLELHPKKISIRTWKQGIDFLGYVLLPHCVALRTKTKQRMMKRVNKKNLPSYLGVCTHASAHEVAQLLACLAYVP